MENSTQRLRSKKDRIRHSILFEVILLLIMLPIGMWVFDTSSEVIGITAISLSLIAMMWNGLFNYLFDLMMLRLFSNVAKNHKVRIVHSLLFELGLLIITVPIIAYTLQLTFLQAFFADIGFVVVALVYAYIFNWCYDYFYPLPTIATANA